MSQHLGLVAGGKALIRPPLISALLCTGNFQAADALAVVFQHSGDSKVERLCWAANAADVMEGILVVPTSPVLEAAVVTPRLTPPRRPSQGEKEVPGS
jgi:hypothetical protein